MRGNKSLLTWVGWVAGCGGRRLGVWRRRALRKSFPKWMGEIVIWFAWTLHAIPGVNYFIFRFALPERWSSETVPGEHDGMNSFAVRPSATCPTGTQMHFLHGRYHF